MTPLDAAKRMAAYDSLAATTLECMYCSSFGHLPDCPTLALPLIVAVLQAAERVVKAWQADKGRGPIPGSMWGSYVDCERMKAYAEEKEAAEQALVTALIGNVVPQESENAPS